MNARPHLSEISKLPEQGSFDAPPPRRWSGLIGELSERKVCRTAVSYMLVMWLNLQIGDVIFPMIGLPDWALSLIIVIGVMGFPVVLILAWAFQITPRGIVLDSDRGRAESDHDGRLDTVVNLLLLLFSVALSILLIMQFLTERQRAGTPAIPPVVAAVVSSLSFQSATENPASRTLASGLRDELRHRLIQLQGIEVLPDGAGLRGSQRRLSISGRVHLDGGAAHVIADFVDLTAGRYLSSMRFDLELDSVLAAESAGAQLIANELASTLQLSARPITPEPRSGGR